MQPAKQAATASIRLSTRSWRIRRRLLAPIAARTAISLSRTVALAGSRVATLPQGVRSRMKKAEGSQHKNPPKGAPHEVQKRADNDLELLGIKRPGVDLRKAMQNRVNIGSSRWQADTLFQPGTHPYDLRVLHGKPCALGAAT